MIQPQLSVQRGIPMCETMPVLSWATAKEAFMWADEYASRPDCRDSVGQLLMKPGSFSRSDLLDQALTITGLVQRLDHPLNLLYRLVYGSGDLDIDRMTIADNVAHILHKRHEGKPIAKLCGMASGIVMELRRQELYGRQMRLARIAAASDVSRSDFYRAETWGMTYIDARTTIQDLLEMADRRLGLALEDLEWLVTSSSSIQT